MIRAMVEQEGRTVFISSHLLDEVEKTCDAAAIVDRGKVITQGSIAELARGGGARNELILGVDDHRAGARELGGKRARARGPPLRRGPARGARRRARTARRGQRDARARGRRRDAPGARAPQPRAALPGGHRAATRSPRERRPSRRWRCRHDATVAAQMTGRADFLKLRRSAGTLIWALVLRDVATGARSYFIVRSHRDPSTPPIPAKYGPAGGASQLRRRPAGARRCSSVRSPRS